MHPVRTVILVVCVAFPTLATTSVALRFVARRRRKLPLLVDDWTALIALLLTIASSILTFYAVKALGLGLAGKQAGPHHLLPALKLFYAIMLLIYLTLGIIKASFILFYKRLFPKPSFLLVSNILMCGVICWTISLFIIQALNSWRYPRFWNSKLLDYGAFNTTMAILDLVLDVFILLLPLQPVSKLQVTRRKKCAIIALFWLGSICIIASALRIYYIGQYLALKPDDPGDWITYIISSNSLWLTVECNMSIIAACLPTLGGFLRSHLGSSANRSQPKDRGISTGKFSHPFDWHLQARRSSRASSEAKTPWVPLQEHPPKAVIASNKSNNSIDPCQRPMWGGIMVNTKFEIEHAMV